MHERRAVAALIAKANRRIRTFTQAAATGDNARRTGFHHTATKVASSGTTDALIALLATI